ncbi:MAG: helix-turn-helix domain-containing protein [Acidimicrobiia bacterium]
MEESDHRLEFFVEPFTEGRPGRHVQAAIDAVTERGLELQVGPFGSVARGPLEELVAVTGPMIHSAIEAGADRVSVHLTAGSRPESNLGVSTLHDALVRMIATVESELGAALRELSREGKQAAVRLLDEHGAFLLRRAVDDVAAAMGVSRITIYNYLNATKGA